MTTVGVGGYLYDKGKTEAPMQGRVKVRKGREKEKKRGGRRSDRWMYREVGREKA